MSEIRLRLRWSGGSTLVTLSSESNFKVLQDLIAEKTTISIPYQDLKKGFPPSTFSYQSGMALGMTDLESGETLTIEKRATPLSLSTLSDSLIMFRRIIPSDNTCLFNSIAYAMEGRQKNLGSYLRTVVSSIVQDDPETYNSSFLSKPNQEYSTWIEQSTSWGGGIELSILSKFYGVNIGAVSIRDEIIHVFGQEFNYPQIIYVIYDGIHYDILVKNIDESQPEASDLTVFDMNDLRTYEQAVEIGRQLKRMRKFTDTGNFSLRCGVCYIGLVGEKEAVEHATATGHTNFAEYDSKN